MTMSSLERFRSRWRRWLGNKTRKDKFYYLTLLQSNWMGWIDCVLGNQDIVYRSLDFRASREEIKELYLIAINHANLEMLMDLDGIYAAEKINL